MGGERSASRPGRFIPGQRATDTHLIQSWLDPRAGLEAVIRANPSPCPESNPGRQARCPVITLLEMKLEVIIFE